MAEPRVWGEPECLGGTVAGETWHHIQDVLRVRIGGHFSICCGDGWEYRVRLVGAERRSGRIEIVDRSSLAPDPAVAVTLVVGLLKGDQMDHVVQAATELGVARVVTMRCERAIGQPRIERWHKIVRMATAQCRRARPPQLATADSLSEALGHYRGDAALLFWERGALSPTLSNEVRDVSIFIGPEGGFSDAEVSAAEAAGAQVCTLGPRILRAETAAIVAPALVMQMVSPFPGGR